MEPFAELTLRIQRAIPLSGGEFQQSPRQGKSASRSIEFLLTGQFKKILEFVWWAVTPDDTTSVVVFDYVQVAKLWKVDMVQFGLETVVEF